MARASFLLLGPGVAIAVLAAAACGSERRNAFDEREDSGVPPFDAAWAPFEDAGPPLLGVDAAPPPPVFGETHDPETCEEATTRKSYVGCDYWPTVTPNSVWTIFDFAVGVANTLATDADVVVTGPNGVTKQVTVPAGELRKIYLPWVLPLKGEENDACGVSPVPKNSLIATESAYHLVSSSPVIVYQFNALEYKAAGGEEADGGTKDWSTCKGSTVKCPSFGDYIGCFSFSNDASLLLPSTAMTTSYRVTGYRGASEKPFIGPEEGVMSPVLSITATEPSTTVTIALAPSAQVVGSLTEPRFDGVAGGSKMTLTLDKAGDVAQLVTVRGKEYDFSGSLVQSNHPVQVITSIPCSTIPADKAACDHIEETVLPAETFGKRYAVTPPTGPSGVPVPHHLRLYGNQDDTKLTYYPAKPASCPATLSAGQVVDCGLLGEAFEVLADKEFGVATFLLGATAYGSKMGDPSQSLFVSVEQYRTKYVFLAPSDYPVLWADIVATQDAEVELDGAKLAAPWTQIGNGSFGIHRVDLTKSGKDGAHTLVAKKPVGVQVIGFGDNTSFQYPAGLNLSIIAPPPPPPK